MPRYSGVLFSLLFLGTCVAVNGFRYPSVWSMLDASTGPASTERGTQDELDQSIEKVPSPSDGKVPSAARSRQPLPEPADLQASRPSPRYLRSTKQENLPLPDDLRPLEPPKVRSFQEISENSTQIPNNPPFEPTNSLNSSSPDNSFCPVDEDAAVSRESSEPLSDKTPSVMPPIPEPTTKNVTEALPEMPVDPEPVAVYQVVPWDVAQPTEKIASESLSPENHSPPSFVFPENDATSTFPDAYDSSGRTPDFGSRSGRWEPPPKVPDDPIIRTSGQDSGRQAVSTVPAVTAPAATAPATAVSQSPQVPDVLKDTAHKPVNVNGVRTNFRQKDYAEALRNQPLPFELPPAASQGWTN